MIGESSFAERENINHAYSIAAKGIRMPTLRKLGLSEKYHQALQRYSEVSYCRLDLAYLGPTLTWIRSLLIEARILSRRSLHSPNGWLRCGTIDQNSMDFGPNSFPSVTTAPSKRAPPSSRGFPRITSSSLKFRFLLFLAKHPKRGCLVDTIVLWRSSISRSLWVGGVPTWFCPVRL